jgi:hypothetical protein
LVQILAQVCNHLLTEMLKNHLKNRAAYKSK